MIESKKPAESSDCSTESVDVVVDIVAIVQADGYVLYVRIDRRGGPRAV